MCFVGFRFKREWNGTCRFSSIVNGPCRVFIYLCLSFVFVLVVLISIVNDTWKSNSLCMRGYNLSNSGWILQVLLVLFFEVKEIFSDSPLVLV